MLIIRKINKLEISRLIRVNDYLFNVKIQTPNKNILFIRDKRAFLLSMTIALYVKKYIICV